MPATRSASKNKYPGKVHKCAPKVWISHVIEFLEAGDKGVQYCCQHKHGLIYSKNDTLAKAISDSSHLNMKDPLASFQKQCQKHFDAATYCDTGEFVRTRHWKIKPEYKKVDIIFKFPGNIKLITDEGKNKLMSIKSTNNDETGCKSLLNKQIKQFRKEQKEKKEEKEREGTAEIIIRKKKDLTTRFPGGLFGDFDGTNKGNKLALEAVPSDTSLIGIREEDAARQLEMLLQVPPSLQPPTGDYNNSFDSSSYSPFDSISDMINDIINDQQLTSGLPDLSEFPKLREWGIYFAGMLFASGWWFFFDAAIISKRTKSDDPFEDVPLVLSTNRKENDDPYAWRARCWLFVGFALLAGGLAGSVSLLVIKYIVPEYPSHYVSYG
ncbi:hypothetical protein E3Q23_01242 [Wallemia mellicola]|uniref:Uncharacterized protein n=1 Tax=Wallemia mellicola TaxID=1708541 RepID=A0A4T0R2V4_9BASI|nr:hypothetical protein E3Q23_01242 [Wallemia mellicola]TIC29331.1 hypothetical protein E3Q11_01425 [Wallemia mellicola]TIC31240.1 hypothetical protein E3Q10_01733 [Wallemia mellicola]